ncbi:alpha/beta hydrolase [Streptomyces sp. NPDC020742]|uniref:alpha/beta fold hydrolase n=1 Tax=unclassified Streptomyces TaxID=2593676 RepID=UPI0033D144BC
MTEIPTAAAPASAPLPPLSTTVAGAPGGPGILLAHGATGSVRSNFAALIPALAASGHRVVAPDYPGSGETPCADGPLELDALADAMVDEAIEAGLETFTVVGYSMGTAVAVRAAARHPGRVRGLVLTAGLAKADARTRVWIDLWQRLLARADHAGFAQARALSGIAPGYFNALTPAERAAALDPDPTLPPAGSAAQIALVGRLDTTADLPDIAVPTLVIATTEDQLLHPDHSRRLADHIPGATYAELATGHLPMVERPQEWQQLIADFLAEHGL